MLDEILQSILVFNIFFVCTFSVRWLLEKKDSNPHGWKFSPLLGARCSGKIADQYSKAHGYNKVVHRRGNEDGRGKASALNAGLKHAGGIVLCFDADYYLSLIHI